MLLLVAMKKNDHIQQKLEAEKSTLEMELKAIAIYNPDTKQWDSVPDTELVGEIDDNDAADRFEDFEERTSMVNTLQTRLQDVEKALAAIADGSYGTCAVCGKDIEADRLAANPAARTCKEHMNG
jgi:RNA polymerase-binding transcription factor DksA